MCSSDLAYLIRCQIVLLVDHHVLRKQLFAQLLPVILLFKLQMLRQRGDLLELLGRRPRQCR